ncbi:hypothetical protein J7E91_33705 [Streptomyces sp. ISL-99]|uniref:hypothetical protein n=1 Tax=Streptomyces sp. ISL-99 TaxID=2819193 RepID=UPI001BE89402|nr:hypothetical protein [Streptomyces sp. ISL-99]MBT2530180.1 hypothetical protein [Streptomyces sp. ISL-99]
MSWSPDVRQASSPAFRPEHRPRLVAVHRRPTVCSAFYCENRTTSVVKPLRTVFDEGAVLGRRLADLSGGGQGAAARGGALTDRSMFLVAARQYGEVYDDFLEVVALPT